VTFLESLESIAGLIAALYGVAWLASVVVAWLVVRRWTP